MYFDKDSTAFLFLLITILIFVYFNYRYFRTFQQENELDLIDFGQPEKIKNEDIIAKENENNDTDEDIEKFIQAYKTGYKVGIKESKYRENIRKH